MPRFIETIRQKPEHTRKVIALSVTAILFLGVVAVWVASFGGARPQKNERNEASIFSQFSAVADTARGAYDDASKSIETLKGEFRAVGTE